MKTRSFEIIRRMHHGRLLLSALCFTACSSGGSPWLDDESGESSATGIRANAYVNDNDDTWQDYIGAIDKWIIPIDKWKSDGSSDDDDEDSEPCGPGILGHEAEWRYPRGASKYDPIAQPRVLILRHDGEDAAPSNPDQRPCEKRRVRQTGKIDLIPGAWLDNQPAPSNDLEPRFDNDNNGKDSDEKSLYSISTIEPKNEAIEPDAGPVGPDAGSVKPKMSLDDALNESIDDALMQTTFMDRRRNFEKAQALRDILQAHFAPGKTDRELSDFPDSNRSFFVPIFSSFWQTSVVRFEQSDVVRTMALFKTFDKLDPNSQWVVWPRGGFARETKEKCKSRTWTSAYWCHIFYEKTKALPAGYVDESHAATIIDHAAHGLKFFHDQKLAHRNVKLEMIRRAEGPDGKDVFKLDGFTASVPLDGSILWRDDRTYLSPEILDLLAESRRDHDEALDLDSYFDNEALLASDIYALGVAYLRLVLGSGHSAPVRFSSLSADTLNRLRGMLHPNPVYRMRVDDVIKSFQSANARGNYVSLGASTADYLAGPAAQMKNAAVLFENAFEAHSPIGGRAWKDYTKKSRQESQTQILKGDVNFDKLGMAVQSEATVNAFFRNDDLFRRPLLETLFATSRPTIRMRDWMGVTKSALGEKIRIAPLLASRTQASMMPQMTYGTRELDWAHAIALSALPRGPMEGYGGSILRDMFVTALRDWYRDVKLVKIKTRARNGDLEAQDERDNRVARWWTRSASLRGVVDDTNLAPLAPFIAKAERTDELEYRSAQLRMIGSSDELNEAIANGEKIVVRLAKTVRLADGMKNRLFFDTNDVDEGVKYVVRSLTGTEVRAPEHENGPKKDKGQVTDAQYLPIVNIVSGEEANRWVHWTKADLPVAASPSPKRIWLMEDSIGDARYDVDREGASAPIRAMREPNEAQLRELIKRGAIEIMAVNVRTWTQVLGTPGVDPPATDKRKSFLERRRNTHLKQQAETAESRMRKDIGVEEQNFFGGIEKWERMARESQFRTEEKRVRADIEVDEKNFRGGVERFERTARPTQSP